MIGPRGIVGGGEIAHIDRIVQRFRIRILQGCWSKIYCQYIVVGEVPINK